MYKNRLITCFRFNSQAVVSREALHQLLDRFIQTGRDRIYVCAWEPLVCALQVVCPISRSFDFDKLLVSGSIIRTE